MLYNLKNPHVLVTVKNRHSFLGLTQNQPEGIGNIHQGREHGLPWVEIYTREHRVWRSFIIT